MASSVSGAPIRSLRNCQPVSVASGTACSGRRMPPMSLPSASTFGTMNGSAEYGPATSER